MSQLTYPTKQVAAIEGMLADFNSNIDTISRVCNQAAGIPFGVAVARSGDGTVNLPDNAADLVMGVAVHDHAHENAALAGVIAIQDKEAVSVLRKGRIWVKTEDACTEGGNVFVRHAANGGNTQLGAFRATDDGANASLLAGARWASTQATPGGLAILEVDMAPPGGILS